MIFHIENKSKEYYKSEDLVNNLFWINKKNPKDSKIFYDTQCITKNDDFYYYKVVIFENEFNNYFKIDISKIFFSVNSKNEICETTTFQETYEYSPNVFNINKIWASFKHVRLEKDIKLFIESKIPWYNTIIINEDFENLDLMPLIKNNQIINNKVLLNYLIGDYKIFDYLNSVGFNLIDSDLLKLIHDLHIHGFLNLYDFIKRNDYTELKNNLEFLHSSCAALKILNINVDLIEVLSSQVRNNKAIIKIDNDKLKQLVLDIKIKLFNILARYNNNEISYSKSILEFPSFFGRSVINTLSNFYELTNYDNLFYIINRIHNHKGCLIKYGNYVILTTYDSLSDGIKIVDSFPLKSSSGKIDTSIFKNEINEYNGYLHSLEDHRIIRANPLFDDEKIFSTYGMQYFFDSSIPY